MTADPALFERVSSNLAAFRAALQEGRPADALIATDKLVEDLPQSSEAWYWKASAHIAACDEMGAAAAFDVANRAQVYDLFDSLQIDVQRFLKDPAYNAQISQVAYGNKLPAVASIFGMQAISQGVADPQFLVHHGLSFQHQGRMDKAFTVFRDTASVHAHMGVMQFYLYACFFMPNGFELYAREARNWAARYGRFAAPLMPRQPLDGRRLRLGYVAPGIMKTQLRQFLTPVLDAHNSENVEVILYVHNPADEAGATCDRMVATGGLDDEQLAELIRKDQVDVLIDTWGHTAGSRMGVFARRAAPVQIAWINFVQTTGLSTMDYVLHSDSMAAPGTDALFTETVFSMGPVTIPYRPSLTPSEPVATPALASGVVTFASFNHPAKFSAETVKAWARILKGCGNSVLLFKYSYFTDPVVQRTFRARFEAHGVDPERIVFEGFSLGAEYAQSFTRIDLALDPSPCPGGTTTCDALANGVPVLTLAGDNFYARIGLQAIDYLGVPELVASSWDDYIDKAVALGNNIDRLNEIRGGIRAAFEASPIRDEQGFTRHFETVLVDRAGRAADAAKVA